MQFLFRPDRGDEQHFSSPSISAAQDYAAEAFKDIPGTVWKIDYVTTTKS